MNFFYNVFATVFLSCVFLSLPAQKLYDARIGENEILTPEPLPNPRLNGPEIYGALPGKKFIYRIPCQGERPINFEVTSLPDGLELNAQKGIIQGLTPEMKGEYEMLILAQNKEGRDCRKFKLIIGDRLALTPPTGWNHWGGHLSAINQEIIEKAADVMVESGLADVGFQYISIDDCWMRMSPEEYKKIQDPEKGKWYRDRHKGMDYDQLVGTPRDEKGGILPNNFFPDMQALTGHIHQYGLKAGIYSGPGRSTCQHMESSLDYELKDVEQYADWGFDLLKYDLCSGGRILQERREQYPDYHQKDFWKPMAVFLKVQNRDIVFNLCQYGKEDPWKWAPHLGIQSWRIGGDLNHHVENYFTQALRIATGLREYSKPGQWNDPDFMYIANLGNHKDQLAPSRPTVLNTNQRYQYVTLWSVICAPFFFSCDICKLDEFTIRLMGNAGVVNINQDIKGHVAEVISDMEERTLMVKEMADGSRVVAAFNRNKEEEVTLHIQWDEFIPWKVAKVYDVWRQKDLGNVKEGINVILSPEGVALFKITQ